MWLRRWREGLYGRWARNWRLASPPPAVAIVLSRLAGATAGVHEAYLSAEPRSANTPARQILHIVVEPKRARIVTRDLTRGLRESFIRDQRPTIRVHDARDPQLSVVRQSAERLHPGRRRGLPWWIVLLGG
jgi:hypothetical protein